MMVPTSFELGSFISFIISFITNDIRKFYLASTWENCTRRRLYVKVSLKNLLLGKNLLPIYTTEAKSFLKNQTVFSVLFFGSQRRTTTTTEIFQSTFLIAITMAVNFFWLKSSFLISAKVFFFFFFFFFYSWLLFSFSFIGILIFFTKESFWPKANKFRLYLRHRKQALKYNLSCST